jgi:uncharacterized coiled-coil DUF342 family protein
VDDFARIIATFEKAADDARAEVVKATAAVSDAHRKLAGLMAQRDNALRELDQALELLQQAPHKVAEAICHAADETHEAHFERKTALLDAARIARGVSL